MKILAIALKNLASLAGEQQVDFTAEPLASAGLFAITGATGAGKSTLLDALCLALFGATPRLAGAQTQARLPDADGDITTTDERNLLRRGCASGYAQVDFIGIDGRRYRARWEVKRARENAAGRLQASNQSLTDLDSGQLLASGKKREFKELLEARLGLNFAQFTRAVLLAQSEFAAFLKADDNERGTLLEKLTDTGLYSRLGIAAYQAAKSAREAVTRLEARSEGSRPLEAEPRAALESEHQTRQQALDAERAAQKALEARQQWLVEGQRLEDDCRQAEQQLEAARLQHQQLAGERRLLELAERLAPQRHRLLRQRELVPLLAGAENTLAAEQSRQQQQREQQVADEARAAQANQALETARQALQAATPSLEAARREEQRQADLHNELTGARLQAESAASEASNATRTLAERTEQRQQLDAQRPALDAALQASAELQPLCAAWDGYRPRLEQARSLALRLAEREAALPALRDGANAAEAREAELRRQLDEAGAALDGHSAAESLAALEAELDALRQRERQTESLAGLWQRRTQAEAQRQAALAQQQRQSEELEQLAEAGKSARQAFDEAEQRLATTRALLERQRLARSESVEALRAALQPEQPCPVCGSTEHPWQAAEALVRALGDADEQALQQAEAHHGQCDEALRRLREQHVGLNAERRQAGERAEALAGELAELDRQMAALDEHARLVAIGPGQRGEWLAERRAEIAAALEQGRSRQRQLLDIQRRCEQLQSQWQQARDAAGQIRQELAGQQQARDRDRQQLDQDEAEFAAIVPAAHWRDWQSAPAQTLAALQGAVQGRLVALQQQAELAEQCRRLDEEIGLQRVRAQALGTAQQQAEQRLAELARRAAEGRAELACLLGTETSAGHWQARLDAGLNEARQLQGEAEKQRQAGAEALAARAEKFNAAQSRRDELAAEAAQLADQNRDWRQRHPDLDDAQLERLLALDGDAQSELRQRLSAGDEALARATERLAERSERRLAHGADGEPADAATLAAQLAAASERCRQAEVACTETAAALLDDDRRRSQSQQLCAEIEAAREEHTRWGRIDGLIGSADGNAFRKIAQAYNLDLLVQHANLQLRELARRYRLRRGGSPLGLLVVDTEMGDELRSVHSLSGGETFLVSLALALGLASMASSKLRIESLFIDEGFGSLDPESLQVAMDALDNLQAQGRKVAVISHVQEMHERIPVQIRVERQGNGRSQLLIRG